MPDMQSLIDRIYYDNRREYTHREGNVLYLESSPLRRPLSMPRTQRTIALVIVCIAAVIGLVFLNNTVFTSIRESADAEKAIEANLAREASIDTIPALNQLINLSNDDIRMRIGEAGNVYLDVSDPTAPDSMTLYKLPADMSLEDGAALYGAGVGNLTAVQATKLFNGSWQLETDHTGTTSMVVRYVDFSTDDPISAIRKAIAKQGFSIDSITSEGVQDDFGNTNTTGTFDAEGTPCSWKITALPLSDMYSISGMPEGACYVSIRTTVQ